MWSVLPLSTTISSHARSLGTLICAMEFSVPPSELARFLVQIMTETSMSEMASFAATVLKSGSGAVSKLREMAKLQPVLECTEILKIVYIAPQPNFLGRCCTAK